MKKVIKIVFSALAVILVGAAIFLYIQIRASGDMDDYKAYYHDDTGKYADGGVKITFLGTSTLLIDDGETQLLTDGFLSRLSLVQTLTSKLSTDEKVIDDILTRFQMDRVKGILPLSEELQMLPNFADDTSAGFQYIIQKTKADNIEFKILQGGKSIILFADGDTETK